MEFSHFRFDPCLQLGVIDRRQIAQVGAQADRLFDVDVPDFVLGLGRVPVDEDADAASQRSGDGDFVGANEWDLEPSELPSGQGREFGV